MGDRGEQTDPVERLREALREDPQWANFVWHDPEAKFGEFHCHNRILHLVADRMYGDPYYLALATLLLEYGADPNARNDMGRTPLHYACGIDSRDKEMVALLLEYGADPNTIDNRGWVPLDLILGDKEEGDAIRAMLIAHGAKQRLARTTTIRNRGRKRRRGPGV